MELTKIPDWFKKEYDKKFETKTRTIKEIDDDPVLWAWFKFGIKMRIHQAYCIHIILICKNKKIIICWARQLGKSIGLGLFNLWATKHNKFSCTVEKITPVYLMSRDDDTAKELLEKLRGIIKEGDSHLYKLKRISKFFSGQYGKPNNQHQITWKENRSFIKCIPPTDTALGKSAAIFHIDEAAKLKILAPLTDKKLYHEVVKPTTSETDGFLILSGTPNGKKGMFYYLFDPDEDRKEHEYERIWFDYTIFADPKSLEEIELKKSKLKEGEELTSEEKYKVRVMREKREMEATGDLKLWQQEYEAKFTVTQFSFFEIEDVEKGLDEDLAPMYEFKEGPCSWGIDYGMNPSRTVITIKAWINNRITTINQIRFPVDFDENNLMDEKFENSIPNLFKRYTTGYIIADDCPQGVTTNNWMKNKGYPIKLFNFRSDQSKGNRNRGYYKYRTSLRAGKIAYPNLKHLIEEMKIIEESDTNINVSIKAPRGSRDDCIDSEMMASTPFLDETEGVSSFTIGIEKEEKKKYSVSVDREWEELKVKADNSWIIEELKKKVDKKT